MRIESIDGIMPATVNDYHGFRIFLTLDDQVSGLGEGNKAHVFAQKENRWNAGDEIEILDVKDTFNLNGPGEEDLPDGEGTYVYAKIQRPKNGGRQGGGFQRQGNRPQQQQRQGFSRPTQEPRTSVPQASAPAAQPVKKITLDEADTVYDRLFVESLGAIKAANSALTVDAAMFAAAQRATAIFNAYVNGKVEIVPKRNPIRDLVQGVDKDTGMDL